MGLVGTILGNDSHGDFCLCMRLCSQKMGDSSAAVVAFHLCRPYCINARWPPRKKSRWGFQLITQKCELVDNLWILCHHSTVTIKGSMCIQVGNPRTWLSLHNFLQLSQNWNALHTELLSNIFWLPNFSGYTEANPDSRFNVLNPINGPFSNYTGFRADNIWPASFCIKYGWLWLWTPYIWLKLWYYWDSRIIK